MAVKERKLNDLEVIGNYIKTVHAFKSKSMNSTEYLRISKMMRYKCFKQDTTIFNYGKYIFTQISYFL